MKTLFILVLFFITNTIDAQISATTSAGKKVILNLDNKTWDWANPQDNQKPCYTNHMANLYIENKTKQDIYFYYFKNHNYYEVEAIIKIVAGDKKQVSNIYTKGAYANGQEYVNDYQWKVSYELYDELKEYTPKYDKIKGFDSGTFTLFDCETKDIVIK